MLIECKLVGTTYIIKALSNEKCTQFTFRDYVFSIFIELSLAPLSYDLSDFTWMRISLDWGYLAIRADENCVFL